MIYKNYTGTSSEYIQKFKENSEVIWQKLLTSQTGRSAEFYKNQLFPILTAKEVEEKDAIKEKLFKESFQYMKRNHRLDLLD